MREVKAKIISEKIAQYRRDANYALTKNLIIECNLKFQQEQALADPA